MLFTTSWDDGYHLDLKLADLLTTYGIKGTFYVCPKAQHGKKMLTEAEVNRLSATHEVGAHTMTHPKLTEISMAQAREEIEQSKQWVEQVVGKECAMFCYPYGFYNEDVQQLVQQAGYRGARTTERLAFASRDPFAMPTTLQVTPFPRRKTFSRWWHRFDAKGPLRVRQKALRSLGISKQVMHSWLSLATDLFDYAVQEDVPVFHLWGHSHELERYEMWDDLEAFLKHVSQSGVECVTNREITAQVAAK